MPLSSPRIAALDVVRGFALCGILLANVRPIANAGALVLSETGNHDLLGTLVDQRFFPIFSLLFGVGFSLLFRSAAGRTPRPRLVLLRRLLVLLGIGLAHFFLLWNGDILTVYAVVGLLVLLPSTWLPRWAVAALAAALVTASLVLGGERYLMVGGLFLLGSALVRYEVIDRMEQSTWVPAALGLGLAAAAVPVMWLDPLAGAGLLFAGAYVCALLVLLRTPLRPVLAAAFAPLGRMALTNYLTATVLVLALSHLPEGRPHAWPATTVLLMAGAILGAQWVLSTLWLRRFRQGPLEWLWRWATWGSRPALLRDDVSAEPPARLAP